LKIENGKLKIENYGREYDMLKDKTKIPTV